MLHTSKINQKKAELEQARTHLMASLDDVTNHLKPGSIARSLVKSGVQAGKNVVDRLNQEAQKRPLATVAAVSGIGFIFLWRSKTGGMLFRLVSSLFRTAPADKDKAEKAQE
ncbi:uncharacterized protein ZMO1_ZMO1611 [Zymomonas mobilis subsp. mobilis ZM4 = ATCC 31821]|uniref:DUF3618 domain-containing protein n=2 Tax=Zymomonas mobilis subsp. mobilis TaxID=120045 RepID=Q5NM25_ZYMMO|nr:hypothetical protein [Zymomonas mobilis]AAV90235.1 hypothetical protein ZMO1611 [Zymomonas mobilis subsp. mobilis ZM4 = ATCC 31821]ACV76139.1 hypothetical protein Za10_1603 [Zymomonas mobilis subsp. mobilis NCIMB 11163]AEH63342.1 conserved hypothetical protein [Zymomonas mobilis subsp. mobilis ATCC 10988]AFN57366.1 hypothetical protein ZZ6_1501 [Zymomonas mobilis subsp. mobilis ATCC 29191]AHB10826.1 hypothetical protein ZCP4_1547 [Zymomonas mobilis subsp. mobilis str. CP4 = NRRL B-14023]